MRKSDLEQIKKTIVFLGFFNDKREEIITGTGFLIQIQNIFHLVTAKHVSFNVDEQGNVLGERNNLYVFLNNKSGEPIAIPIAKSKQDGYEWVLSANSTVDIAMIPFGIDPKSFDALFLDEKLFLDVSQIIETHEIFYVSYQPNVSIFKQDGKVMPIVRRGMISRINTDKTFFIDGTAFPGNSGSPVFVLPAAARISEDGNVTLGRDNLGGKFIGLIGSYLPYQDVAVSQQTGRARIVFEENTGLSKVWSVNHLQELINTEICKNQIQKALSTKK